MIRINDINPMLFNFVEELNEVKVCSVFSVIAQIENFEKIEWTLIKLLFLARLYKSTEVLLLSL